METLVHELRAMLLQFEHSPLKDFYFRRGQWSIFMARPGGAANPMLAGDEADEGELLAAVATPLVALRAPHLGMFEPACAAGDSVAAGAVIGKIDVLGRKTDVLADKAGRVAQVLVAANDLVEFGDALVEIETAA